MLDNITRDATAIAGRTTPSIIAGALGTILGLGPSDWFYVVSGIFVVLQAAHFVWKWAREWRKP